MTFESFYWNGAALAPELERAADQLRDGRTSPEARVAAFLALLRSESPVARGVALDYLSLCHARQRHGPEGDAFIAAVRPAARACALRELVSPPYERHEEDASPRLGANHASAFYAMWHMATPEDGPALAHALAANRDPDVLEAGLGAASAAAYDAPDIAPELSRVLLAMIDDPTLPADARARAVSAIGVTAGEAFTPQLERALANPELAVASAAALLLLQRDRQRYRARIAPLASTWPSGADVPGHLDEVRRLLEQDG